MKLRNKILIAVAVVWGVFLVATFASSDVFLINSFLGFEKAYAEDDLLRIDHALNRYNHDLHAFTADWAHWNDLYSFMKGANPKFVRDNINTASLSNLHVDLMTYWSSSGKLISGTAVDAQKKESKTMPSGLNNYLYPNSLLLSQHNPKKHINGYILTAKGIMLIDAEAITDSTHHQPSVGVLVNGRYLNQSLINDLAYITNVPIKLYLPHTISASPNLSRIFDTLSHTQTGHYNAPINHHYLQAYSLISDISGKPIGMLEMTIPRLLYLSGLHAIKYYLIAFVIAGALFSLFLLWLLSALIVKRLEKLDKELTLISSKQYLRQRVKMEGRDELTTVSATINRLLEKIEQTESQLEKTTKMHTDELPIMTSQEKILEAELHNAIQNNELELYFQPQLNLRTEKMDHLEALIRWHHPQLGLISPNSFIPVAESTGLIMPLGEWVIKEACRINKEWQKKGLSAVCIAVNISPKQFKHQDIAKIISDALNKTKLPANTLEIEITESAIMEDLTLTTKKLNTIHDMGINICIDDFGIGYTSISYLKQFPISVLKIDQHFIKGIPDDKDDCAITSAVIALGHSLGLKVVAEGVETAQQKQFLADHQCDYIQGFYLGEPLPADKIGSILS